MLAVVRKVNQPIKLSTIMPYFKGQLVNRDLPGNMAIKMISVYFLCA